MLWVACGHSAEEPRGLGWIKREQIDRLGSGDFLICHFGLCDLLALSGPDFPIYESESESLSVMSNSLGPHGLYSPWNSYSLFLLQGTVPTQGLNPGLLHCRQILYQLSHKGSPSVEGDAFSGSFLRSSPSSDSLCGKDQ